MSTSVAPANSTIASTVIVGGGISGLYSALLAHDSGQKNIHVYESTDRTGGKIISSSLNGQTLNMGAEFIDTDHARLRALCYRLGLQLDENPTMLEDLFQGPDGKIVPNFLEKYAPVAQAVRRDKEVITRDPDGAYAQALKSMPLTAYMQHLAESVPANENPGVMGKIWNAMTLKSGRIDPTILQTAATAYTSEVGQSVENITAAQFVAETSPDDETFLSSDCKFRVHGGTQAMIDKLHEYLEANGVRFHFNEKLAAATKALQGGVNLSFTGPSGAHQLHTPNAVLALPTYALAGVQGLDTFGMPAFTPQLLGDVQYTNNVKFTVAVKPGVRLPDQNLFTPNVQNWTPAPGFITFLCNNHDGLNPAQLVQQSLTNYAALVGEGKSPADLFDIGPGKIAFANPGKIGCYATPNHKNAFVAEKIYSQMESLADQGLGIVGTYMPLNGSVGFMECGAASAERAHQRMMAAAVPESTKFRDKVKPAVAANQNEQLAQQGMAI